MAPEELASRQTNARKEDESSRSSSYITALTDADVLLGRGAPVQKRKGNKRFREIVMEEKEAYSATGKHAVKDQIAHRILNSVSAKGGRFVRRIESEQERGALGVPHNVSEAWVVVSENVAKEKVKQALREHTASQKKKTTSPRKRRRKAQPKAAPSREFSSSESDSDEASSPSSASECDTAAAQEDNNNSSVRAPSSAATLPALIPTEVISTRDADDDVSFRLKHPSLRKRDLLRMRRQQQAAAASSSGLTAGPPREKTLHHLDGRTLLKPTETRALDQNEHRPLGDDGGGDRKPKARDDSTTK